MFKLYSSSSTKIYFYLKLHAKIHISKTLIKPEVKGVGWSGARSLGRTLAAWAKAVSLGPSILVVLQAAFLQ
jgi:hypothetical protein